MVDKNKISVPTHFKFTLHKSIFPPKNDKKVRKIFLLRKTIAIRCFINEFAELAERKTFSLSLKNPFFTPPVLFSLLVSLPRTQYVDQPSISTVTNLFIEFCFVFHTQKWRK